MPIIDNSTLRVLREIRDGIEEQNSALFRCQELVDTNKEFYLVPLGEGVRIMVSNDLSVGVIRDQELIHRNKLIRLLLDLEKWAKSARESLEKRLDEDKIRD